MIDIEERGDGCILSVKAQPGAKRNAILGEHFGALKVAVTAAPEKGKANKAIIEVLCKELQFRKSQIILYNGETHRDKRFLIAEITKDELRTKIMERKK